MGTNARYRALIDLIEEEEGRAPDVLWGTYMGDTPPRDFMRGKAGAPAWELDRAIDGAPDVLNLTATAWAVFVGARAAIVRKLGQYIEDTMKAEDRS